MASSVEELVAELEATAAEIGLYAREHAIGTPDSEMAPLEPDMVVEAIKEGAPFMIVMTFTVGDLAWTDRIQNPKAFQDHQEFRKIVPNVAADVIKADLERRIREGKPLFGKEDEDGSTEG